MDYRSITFEPLSSRTAGLVAALLAGAGTLSTSALARDVAGTDNTKNLAIPNSDPRPYGPDLDGNQIVNMSDLMIMLAVMGGNPQNPAWTQAADINGDGVIDHRDLNEVITNFGRTIIPPPQPVGHNDPGSTVGRPRAPIGSPGIVRPTTPPPPPPPPEPATRLLPGDGFTGLFEIPAVVGDPNAPGADAKAIARWNVVPWQTVTGEFNVGVVAFHINGIEKVVFSANGGEEVVVTEMTMNPQSETAEYWVTLDAADFADGPVEIRAVVYPNDGAPRALQGDITSTSRRHGEHSFLVYANANGALDAPVIWVSPTLGNDTTGNGTEANPYRSLMKAARAVSDENGGTADGGTVYLMEGDHSWGSYSFAMLTNVHNRWLHFTAAPGLTREQVRISGVSSGNWANGLRIGLQRISNVTVNHPASISSGDAGAAVWIDNCIFNGPAPNSHGVYTDYHPVNTPKFPRGVYVTDTTFYDTLRPSRDWTYARNVTLDRVGLDGFFNTSVLINSEVRNLGIYDNGGHRDVVQFYQGRENTIVYGFRAVENIIAQPLFSRGTTDNRDMSNTALVNMIFAMPNDTSSHRSQWQQVGDHLLIWNCVFLDLPFLFTNDGSVQTGMTNTSIRGSIFQKLMYSATGVPVNAIQAISNHYIDPSSYAAVAPGSNVSTGNPQFMDIVSKDFRPAIGSPLRARMEPVVPFDANSVSRPAMASVGALEP